MPLRDSIATGEVYHVMSKSIAGYKVFASQREYQRMQQMLRYFRYAADLPKFSQFVVREEVKRQGFEKCVEKYWGGARQHVEIIAYCLMPTHIHVLLRQLREHGTSTFMFKLLNSYSRYFNTKYKRKGPLWMSRFKSVLVESDEQFTHLTRYLHLNPTTAELVKSVQDWQWSSYKEYVEAAAEYPLCDFAELLNMTPEQYRLFVSDHKDFQRELGKIKRLALE